MLLPSPTTSDANGAGAHGDGGPDLRTALLATPSAADGNGGGKYNSPGHANSLPGDVREHLMPTPRAGDGEKGGPNQRGSSGDLMLPSAVTLLPTPVASEGTKPSNTMGVARRQATGEVFLTNVIVSLEGMDPTEALLPTPACNDMGAAYTPEQWDAWTERMKAEHNNGNGHGPSLNIEAQRVALLPTTTTKDAQASGGSSPSDVTLTGAVVRTNLGEQENPRHADSTQGRPGEVLRDVRGATDPQEVCERQAGGPDSVPQEAALFAEVREQSQGDPARLAQVAGASDPEAAGLPGVRRGETSARSPHRPEPREQPARESHDPLCVLPPSAPLERGPGAACGCGAHWGRYGTAIRRWERILGRKAPWPTQLSTRGRPQLASRLSEFLMGVPLGWITDVPGITRNEALKAAGNGVVPQQAAEALRFLLAMPTGREIADAHQPDDLLELLAVQA